MARTIGVFALVTCIVATPGCAATLAPSKASTVITVATGVTPCLIGARAVDVVHNADGTTSPFVIPPKQVFVVTDVEATIVNASASTSVSVGIQRVTGVTTNTLAFVNGNANSQGIFYGQLTIPSGAIVKPGVTMCVFANSLVDGTLSGGFTLVHGFFAPNK